MYNNMSLQPLKYIGVQSDYLAIHIKQINEASFSKLKISLVFYGDKLAAAQKHGKSIQYTYISYSSNVFYSTTHKIF